MERSKASDGSQKSAENGRDWQSASSPRDNGNFHSSDTQNYQGRSPSDIGQSNMSSPRSPSVRSDYTDDNDSPRSPGGNSEKSQSSTVSNSSRNFESSYSSFESSPRSTSSSSSVSAHHDPSTVADGYDPVGFLFSKVVENYHAAVKRIDAIIGDDEGASFHHQKEQEYHDKGHAKHEYESNDKLRNYESHIKDSLKAQIEAQPSDSSSSSSGEEMQEKGDPFGNFQDKEKGKSFSLSAANDKESRDQSGKGERNEINSDIKGSGKIEQSLEENNVSGGKSASGSSSSSYASAWKDSQKDEDKDDEDGDNDDEENDEDEKEQDTNSSSNDKTLSSSSPPAWKSPFSESKDSGKQKENSSNGNSNSNSNSSNTMQQDGKDASGNFQDKEKGKSFSLSSSATRDSSINSRKANKQDEQPEPSKDTLKDNEDMVEASEDKTSQGKQPQQHKKESNSKKSQDSIKEGKPSSSPSSSVATSSGSIPKGDFWSREAAKLHTEQDDGTADKENASNEGYSNYRENKGRDKHNNAKDLSIKGFQGGKEHRDSDTAKQREQENFINSNDKENRVNNN
jgi:hypothetical protein